MNLLMLGTVSNDVSAAAEGQLPYVEKNYGGEAAGVIIVSTTFYRLLD